MFPPKPAQQPGSAIDDKSNPLIGKYDDFYSNAKVYDQKFGIVLTSDNLRTPAKTSLSYGPDNFYPWRPFAALDRTKKPDKEREEMLAKFFAIHIDVQHFKPNEIHIKVTGRVCNVKASHGDREDDHGFISRRFERQFTLPHDINVETVKSVISSDGVLTFKAARTKPKKIRRHSNAVMNPLEFSNEKDSKYYQQMEEFIQQESFTNKESEIEIPIHFASNETEHDEKKESEK